ncbi:putative rRNA-processing protein EBP2-like protein [Hibiscus syriacus]|uniref:rRNA-processing protein EBP2-like protein n=1 Tax=Hibiscus syriacus TaxID=106335 RepID=A0A6A3D7G6_HIBSY|nr:probable rRNA-processing protein EBP2 homolog [Hibiscus syriacus]KAE8736474.1 putative rRNA-processing protein EBP2-like protein [Hibiscus syriacus]
MGLQSKDLSLLQDENNVADGVEDVLDDLSDVEESESEQEDVKLAEPSKTTIYNREGLVEKLEDIVWPDNVNWIYKLSLDIDQGKEVDVNDDLARELAFYTQALEGTRLAFEKKHIEEAEERRKAREAKRIAKEVQAEKLKERAKQKKQEIEEVKKWRKQRQQSGFKDGKDSMPDLGFREGKAFERSSKKRPGVSPGDRSGGKAKQGSGKGNTKNKKNMEFRNSKFGLGGRKGLKKQNTLETTNDLRAFNNGGVAENLLS